MARANPFSSLNKKKTPQEQYQEKKKQEKETGKVERTVAIPRSQPSSGYMNKQYKGESETKKSSYQWEKDILTPLSIRQYGRSHNDKFKKWASEQGLSESEAKEFRTWLDSKEDKQKTKSSNIDDILSSASKKASERKVRIDVPEKPKEPSIIDRLKKSELGKATKGAMEFFNPFDDVKAGDAVRNYLNAPTSGAAKEAQRFANRTVDSASLGAMSNLDKKVNDRDPYYTSQREFGEGGGTDMISTGLGYLVPGVGAYKALNATKAGKGLTALGNKNIASRLGSEAAKGAVIGAGMSGAEVGIREGLNPEDYTAIENLKHIGLNTALGAIADPALYGLGKAAGKGLETLAERTISQLKPTDEATSRIISNALEGVERRSLSRQPLAKSKFKSSNGETSPVQSSPFDTLRAQPIEQTIPPRIQELRTEFGESVNSQYEYLKTSMGKGTQPGGLVRDIDGTVIDAYGTVSNNPKWYQDFYAQHSRRPTNAELRELAEIHVREGFEDEVGLLPSWRPKELDEIDSQIEELTTIIKNQPDQTEAIMPILEALENDKNELLKLYSTMDEAFSGANNQMRPATETAATREAFEPIEALRDDGIPLARADNNATPIVPQPVNENITYQSGDSLPDTIEHIGSKIDLEAPSLKARFDKLVTQTTDNLDPIKQFSKFKEEVTGEALPASKDPYKLGLNTRHADQTSYQILNNDLVNMEGEIIGDSLKSITSNLNKKQLKAFEDYLVNKHAITRQTKGQKVFPGEMEMNAQKSAAKVTEYEASNPEFIELSEQLYTFQRQRNEAWLIESGLLTPEQLTIYTQEYPHYIPNMRLFKDAEKGGRGTAGQGFNNQNSQIKKVNKTGSERRLVSPIESIIEQTDNIVKAARRNETMRVMIQHINDDPDLFKDIIEIVPTTKEADQALKSFDDEGVDGLITELNDSFVKQNPDLTKGNIVFGVVNGQKVHLKVHDPLFLDAITNLSPQAQNVVIKWAGELTRVMKTLTTGINPVFSFARNIWRDIPTAYVNSKSVDNPATFTKDYAAAVISVLRNDESFKMYKRMGGGHASAVSQDINLLAQSKRNVTKDRSLRSLGGKMLGGLENFNNLAEAPPRLAEFKRLVKQDPSYDGKVSALYEANDITTNFKRHGDVTRQLDAFFPYLNAAVQGLNKTWRVVKDNPIKSTIKGFIGVSVPTAIMYAVNHDDPNYHELSDFIKDNNYLIPKGDGTFYKIPKPRELGVMFGSDLERALTMWSQEDPEAFEGWKETVLTNFLPPVVPGINARTIFAPINDIRANKNFMDSPIVPADLKGLSPELQYDSKTSEIAKGFGDLTNKSPKEIDYLIKSYSGIVGELGIPLTTKGGGVGDTLVQKISADPVFSNDHATKFYNLKEKLDTASADFNRLGIESEHLDDDLRKEMNKQAKEISKIRKEVKAIQNDESLSNKEKREQIRELQKKINEFYKIAE